MDIAPDATAAINDYTDKVRSALPLQPSTRLAVVDRLYRDIMAACTSMTREAGGQAIDLATAHTHLDALGTPEACAAKLAAAAQADAWQWPGDYFAEQLGSGRFAGKAEEFARILAEKGEHVALLSMEATAGALDVAAQKMREAVERLKTRQ
jgi:hypothetical protein